VAQFDEQVAAPIDLAYNPYTNDSFVERSSQRVITGCKFLVVRNNQVFVSPDALPVASPRKTTSISTLFDLSSWQLDFAAA
jgi:hypothetical protein